MQTFQRNYAFTVTVFDFTTAAPPPVAYLPANLLAEALVATVDTPAIVLLDTAGSADIYDCLCDALNDLAGLPRHIAIVLYAVRYDSGASLIVTLYERADQRTSI